jgi:ribosome-associated toxin RatA of RatAB toxin-antitoxin module
MRLLPRALALPLVLLSLVSAPVLTEVPAAPALGGEERLRLARGEILVSAELPPGADAEAQGGTAVALVRATPDAVWRVLVDYPRHSGLFPRVVAARVLEHEDRRTLVRYVIGVGPFSFGFHVNNYPDAGHRRLDWRLAGDQPNDLFRASRGYWQLDPETEGVVVTYAMAARTVLPGFLTRGAERDGLIQTIRAVRARAEGEPSHRSGGSGGGGGPTPRG